jgi:hypothetical protein
MVGLPVRKRFDLIHPPPPTSDKLGRRRDCSSSGGGGARGGFELICSRLLCRVAKSFGSLAGFWCLSALHGKSATQPNSGVCQHCVTSRNTPATHESVDRVPSSFRSCSSDRLEVNFTNILVN